MATRIVNNGDFSEFMSELASALDAQWDSNEHILYRGDNSTMGFLCLDDSSGGISISIKNIDGQYLTVHEGDSIIIEKNGACAVFGVISSGSESNYLTGLRCAIVPYSSSDGGGYMYILNITESGRTDYSYYFGFSDSTTADMEEQSSSGGSSIARVKEAIPTVDIVSLAPLAIQEKYTFSAFVAYAAPGGTLGNVPFTINGAKYIPLSGNLAIAMS